MFHGPTVPPSDGPPRKASALLLVLVVLALLTLSVYAFAKLMTTEYKVAHLYGRRIQSTALAESGLEFVRHLLDEDQTVIEQSGGIYDNPSVLRDVLVIDANRPDKRGRFSVVAPWSDNQTSELRYGLENDSARINVNALPLVEQREEGSGRQLLMTLPGMTEPIADAVLDWVDEDSQSRESGAESDYYTALNPPYAPKNGPLDTIEELLLVRDVTPQLLFGADLDRNGILDDEETNFATNAGFEISAEEFGRGWASFLTIYSLEANVRPDGKPRINLNGNDLKTLFDELKTAFDEKTATFLVAFRQNGPHQGAAEGPTGQAVQLDFKREGSHKIESLLDLIEVTVQVPSENEDEPAATLKSPFSKNKGEMRQYLPQLLDHATVDSNKTIPGRININQAPVNILRGIPGINEHMVARIVATRDPEVTSARPNRRYATWLLTEEIVNLEQMKRLMPFITAGGDVYRAQIIGYFEKGAPVGRIETVLNTTSSPPQLLFWRDISDFPIPREQLVND